MTLPGIEQLTFIQLIRVPEDVFDLSKEVLSPDDFLRLVRMISLLNLYGLKVDLLNNPLAAVASRVLKMPWVPPSPPLYRPGSIMITAERRITLAHSTTDHFGIYKPGILRRIIDSDDYCRAVSQDRLICRNCVYSRLCSMEGMVRPSEWYRDMFPQVPYCKTSTGQGLVLWVTSHRHLPPHMLKDQAEWFPFQGAISSMSNFMSTKRLRQDNGNKKNQDNSCSDRKRRSGLWQRKRKRTKKQKPKRDMMDLIADASRDNSTVGMHFLAS